MKLQRKKLEAYAQQLQTHR